MLNNSIHKLAPGTYAINHREIFGMRSPYKTEWARVLENVGWAKWVPERKVWICKKEHRHQMLRIWRALHPGILLETPIKIGEAA